MGKVKNYGVKKKTEELKCIKRKNGRQKMHLYRDVLYAKEHAFQSAI